MFDLNICTHDRLIGSFCITFTFCYNKWNPPGHSKLATPGCFYTAICLGATVNAQIAIPRDDDRPTRYYTDLGGAEEYQKPRYYKTNRRSDRIPAYQYDESASDEDYYRAQLKKTQEPDYQYQPTTTPTHKDYEQILKNTHLARLRATSKKQPPTAPQPQVEQYLKEVNPTTQTLVNSQTFYQRPSNYLRFNEQQQQIANLKQQQQQEQSEETQRAALKQPAYRYVLQSELQQQKLYPEYQQQQYEPALQAPQEPPKAKPHFNLVAYQNALLAQQKLLAQQEAAQEESKFYVNQNAPKKQKGIKQKALVPRPQHQHDQYPQTEQPERYQYQPEQPPARYQHRRPPVYQKPTEYQPEEVEPREEYQIPTRTHHKQKTRYNAPSKYHQVEEQLDDYQDDEPQYRRPVKYQAQSEEPQYRRPVPRKQKTKYAQPPPAEEQREPKHQQQYHPEDLTQYQTAQHLRYLQPGRHIFHYVPEERPVTPAARPRPQQYQEESRQFVQYYYPDLVNQASVELPVRHRPNTARPMIAAYQPENSRYYRNLDRPTSYVEGI